ncbi:DNA recombination protein RmuC [Chelatococcus reniformis]|uniref:DNA recombination protein RmuC homolog n=1 Tax=Chelatococcus reniformis TaxID=1494448 RepID=A0A916UQC7_9HYPH|nr:DNA recombination protein RmuC [Chelatococcus reniformis]GGC79951.1 DNA recombinase [Chelatococcus reniformis]
MDQILLLVGERAVTYGDAAAILAVVSFVVLMVIAVSVVRGARHRGSVAALLEAQARELDGRVAELQRMQAELKGGVQASLHGLGVRQSDMQRFVAERIEVLQHRVGRGLADTVERTTENLAQLNERLAVIDTAQRNLSELTGQVVGLKDILANKQARGAYGQGRMEAIVRDGLPAGAYSFQPTLANNRRPDCLIHLPGDHPLVIDAKFPLEGFAAFRGAQSDEARRGAAQRVRADLGVHIKDVAEKYLVPGETQDMALLFVPSEALYADLHEHFDDVVQRAHRARVVIVSPSLLALAIQITRALVRDARMREEARKIQAEVRLLLDDVERLRGRVGKLDTHFRQVQEDVAAVTTSSEKIVKRADRIEALEFDDAPVAPAGKLSAAE